MMSVLQNNFLRISLSASNLNGIAAALFSISLGSVAGTLIFIMAAMAGCFNKYRSLKLPQKYSNFWLRRLTDPSITPQILMIAASINALMNGYYFFTYDNNSFYYFVLSCAWGFGFLGDDMMRRNDKTNFLNDVTIGKEKNIWIQALWVTVRDPILYYIICNIFFTLAILISPEGEITNTLKILTACILFVSLFAIFYSFLKALDVIKGKISTKQSHDGIVSVCGICINLVLTIMALLQGLPWILLAQIVFCLSNVMIFFETRNALNKEYK